MYRVEAVGLYINFHLYLGNYDFCEYVKFAAILQKMDVLSITA